MKLIFRKDEDLKISVVQEVDKQEAEFSYIEMIKHLIDSKKLKPPKVEGDFSDAEKKSIKSMVTYINDEIKALDEEWEEE